MNAIDVELGLDRLEAELAPELAAHAIAHHARALVDPAAEAPPWPALLRDGRAVRLARAAESVGDPRLRARAGTLRRWAWAATLAADPGWRDAAGAARDLAGLAERHRALGGVASRAGFRDARQFLDAIHGPIPAQFAPLDFPSTTLDHPSSTLDRPSTPTADWPLAEPAETGPLPTWRGVCDRLVAAHDLDTAGLDVRPGARSLTLVIAPGQARCVFGPGRDPLDALAVAVHELGHGLFAAQQAGLPLGLAATPARWFDEAIAAWAVRSLEAEPRLAAPARARRQQRETLTARLAAAEAAIFAGATISAAWQRWLPELTPAAVPALFDDPGAMASYHAADRAALQPGPGDLRRWARHWADG